MVSAAVGVGEAAIDSWGQKTDRGNVFVGANAPKKPIGAFEERVVLEEDEPDLDFWKAAFAENSPTSEINPEYNESGWRIEEKWFRRKKKKDASGEWRGYYVNRKRGVVSAGQKSTSGTVGLVGKKMKHVKGSRIKGRGPKRTRGGRRKKDVVESGVANGL